MRVEGNAPCVACIVQEALMAEVPRARAALDAHVGVAGVVEQGLRFLGILSVAEANKVRPHLFEGVCGLWRKESHAEWWLDFCWVGGVRVEGHAPCVVCTAQVPLMAEVPRARAALDGHMGDAGVADQGLWFLRHLAVAQANKVKPRVCVSVGAWVVGCVLAA